MANRDFWFDDVTVFLTMSQKLAMISTSIGNDGALCEENYCKKWCSCSKGSVPGSTHSLWIEYYMPDSLYVYLKSVENSRGYDSSWQQFGCGEGVKNDVCGSTWNSVLHSCIGSNKEIISPTKNGEEGIFVHQRGGDLGNDGEDKGELDNGWESILRKVNWEDVMHDKENWSPVIFKGNCILQ